MRFDEIWIGLGSSVVPMLMFWFGGLYAGYIREYLVSEIETLSVHGWGDMSVACSKRFRKKLW